eukprot:2041944-Amphidinium_carterae.1
MSKQERKQGLVSFLVFLLKDGFSKWLRGAMEKFSNSIISITVASGKRKATDGRCEDPFVQKTGLWQLVHESCEPKQCYSIAIPNEDVLTCGPTFDSISFCHFQYSVDFGNLLCNTCGMALVVTPFGGDTIRLYEDIRTPFPEERSYGRQSQ